MRKFLLSLFLTISIFSADAQLTEAEVAKAKDLVNKNSAAIGLSAGDLQNLIVSSTYVSVEGIRMVYLYQSYKGIPVYNQMHVLAFRNGQLVSKAGGRIAGFETKVNNPSGVPSLPVKQAVMEALLFAKVPLQRMPSAIADPVINDFGKMDFGKLGVALENITAELFWFPVNEKQWNLAWQVFIAPDNSSDMWSVKIDAASGAVIGQYNYTVYCNWHKDEASATGCTDVTHKKKEPKTAVANYVQKANTGAESPVVNSASYRVVKYPAESPQHTGGTPQLHVDPWTMAPGNATSLKWHNDGTQEHDSTRGNNVWAAEDRSNTNAVFNNAALSTTPQPNLTFDFVPDFTQAPTVTTPPNQQFNITNLFYWNNILHDILYIYGFDEVAGNFQNSNQGRGGLGNDYVIGDAQDGGGTNNANFATPVDGQRPRMQMFLWTAPNPDRDGDVDNGIIAHEFGHGISNRLTGGPANSSCVGNAEHGGEGWSDYYGLMVTTDWSTATVNDGPNPRPIGTYALGQPVTGVGIRSRPYSTNMAVNNLVYSASLPAQVHSRGEYWCMALWEMTWEMIQQTGINPNLFNPTASGGNSAAMKLVTEGMKLQPCGPGFIDARDAILRADTIFFNGLYSCSIWKAFAKRGMGRNASQGSAGSVTDQVPSFIVDNGFFRVTESAPAVPEGQNVTYTNTVTAGVCSPLTNVFVTDTLPTNVTYVSGGTYNAGNRTVTFGPVSLNSGQSQVYPFTVTINAGTYFAPVDLVNETVTGATIPAPWVINPATGTTWSVSTVNSQSAPNAFFAPNPAVVSDMTLQSGSFTLNSTTVSNYSTLSFWHKFNTEDGWDGGVVEVSTNGGTTWTDLGSRMVSGKYNGSLGIGSNNPIGGRSAFTGTNGAGFMRTVINLSSFAGQTVQFRFRFTSDDNTNVAGGGWWVDDILLRSEPAVQIKSNLFSSTNQLLQSSDTITRILPATVVCVPASVTAQPSNVNSCAGNNATFSITAAGTAPTYQWQVNTGSGFVNIPAGAPYSGETTATLTVTGITGAMNGYIYRCVVSNSCTSPAVNSNSAVLNVGANASITSQPANVTVCEGVNTSFSVTATGASSFQWQVNTGSGFVNIPAGAPYSGQTTATLTITGTLATMNGYQYRCVLGSCSGSLNSNSATLTISVPVSITIHPASVSVCQGANHTFTISTTGTVSNYQWQISTDNGSTYSNIAGATTSSHTLNGVLIGQSGYRFRCVVTGACGPVTSNTAILTVNPLPSVSVTVPSVVCVSDPAFTLTGSPAGGTWSGPGVSAGTFNPTAAGVGTHTVSYAVTELGCTTTQTAIIRVNQCPERNRLLTDFEAVFVYPVPNNGTFSIRMNTDRYKNLGVNVYASDGKLVRSLQFSGIGYGSVVPVNLGNAPSGAYYLYLYNTEFEFIKKGTGIVVYR
jgi:extracellular elastinolytic metalloproteinase